MKNTLPSLFAITFVFITACNFKPQKAKPNITKDTLAYTYKVVKERAADCGKKPDSSCTTAQIKYPVFADQAALNDTVNNRLLNLFLPGNKEANSPEAQAKGFIAGYETYKKHDKRNISFNLATYAKVLRQDSSLATVEYGGYSFAGGAHGSSLTLFLNWDTKASKVITLDDIVTSKEQLTAIAEKIFRKNENLKDTSSLKRDYFFKGGKFALNNNYLISPVGLRFLYNQYEIKPYAAGTTDLFLPYAQIKSLLKPHTVASQFSK
jgi:hypothetical protein